MYLLIFFKRLGAYSGIERRKPEAKSCRKFEIKITNVSDLALTLKAESVSLDPNLAEIWKSGLPA